MLCGCSRQNEISDRPFEETAAAASAKTPAGRRVFLEDIATSSGVGWKAEPTGTVNGVSVLGGDVIAAELPVDSRLVFDLGMEKTMNLSGFTHIVFNINNRGPVSEVCIGMESSAGSWSSRLFPLKRGQNEIRVAIHRLWRRADFDPKKIRAIALEFPNRFAPVNFELGKVELENQARIVEDIPQGFRLIKIGGDYSLTMPYGEHVDISCGDDGLWRFGLYQPVMRLTARGEKPSGVGGENLEIMGGKRIGKLELIEHDNLRIRFRNSWFFLGHDDEISARTPRQIIWEHTIYCDGRWVCNVSLDNAGGREIGEVEMEMIINQAAWYGGKVEKLFKNENFIGPQGRWSYMLVNKDVMDKYYIRNYLRPARVRPVFAKKNIYSGGDREKDRFDESQGVYLLAGKGEGGCRFEIVPSTDVLERPVFIIKGPWAKLPTISVAGMKVSRARMLEDGSVLFILPAIVEKPLVVEIFGKITD